MHRTQNVGLSRLAHWILLIIGKYHHILSTVSKGLDQIFGHILHIIDTAAQLPLLSKVVDSNQQRFAFAGTFRILKAVPLGCPVAEGYCAAWRGRGASAIRLRGSCMLSERSYHRELDFLYLIRNFVTGGGVDERVTDPVEEHNPDLAAVAKQDARQQRNHYNKRRNMHYIHCCRAATASVVDYSRNWADYMAVGVDTAGQDILHSVAAADDVAEADGTVAAGDDGAGEDDDAVGDAAAWKNKHRRKKRSSVSAVSPMHSDQGFTHGYPWFGGG